MAFADNAYSRFVAWVKIILPLAAIALLSMMFLFARTNDPETVIPFADIDVEQLAREQRLANPSYAGVTEDGRAISFSAGEIQGIANSSDQIVALDLAATLTRGEEEELRIQAPRAVINQDTGDARLLGGALMSTASGFTVQTDELRANLRNTAFESAGTIQIEGPFGSVVAGQMRITTKPETGDYLVDFTNGVKVLYLP